jgi:hypothetical protein
MDEANGAKSRLERNIKLRIGERIRAPHIHVARPPSFYELCASLHWNTAG